MLQLQVIRENPEEVIKALQKKHYAAAEENVRKLIDLDAEKRSAQQELESIQQEVNKMSKEIGLLFKQGKKEEADALKEQTARHKDRNKELSGKVSDLEKEILALLYSIPNTPHESVPEGKDASENVIEKQVGEIDHLPQDALPHWELAAKYDIIDFELGNKITGAGFPVYKGKGAKLQRALINFFLDRASKAGYVEIEPPLLVNEASGYGTGQLPDKDAQMYYVGLDNFYLIPTAEVPVTNLYRDCLLQEKDLPVKHCAYSACFRREAGSYGKDVRGLNRLHQFDKVEIVRIEKPEDSYRVLQEMCEHVGSLLRACGVFAGGTGADLPRGALMRGGHQLHFGLDFRLRGVQRGAETLAGSELGVQFRDLPGQPPAFALQRSRRQDALAAYAQRERGGVAPGGGRLVGEPPDSGRYPDSGSLAAVHGL